MNPLNLLARSSSPELTPEEEALLTRELSAAYHMDEAAASSRDVERIAEKIRARLHSDEVTHSATAAPTPCHDLPTPFGGRGGKARGGSLPDCACLIPDHDVTQHKPSPSPKT